MWSCLSAGLGTDTRATAPCWIPTAPALAPPSSWHMLSCSGSGKGTVCSSNSPWLRQDFCSCVRSNSLVRTRKPNIIYKIFGSDNCVLVHCFCNGGLDHWELFFCIFRILIDWRSCSASLYFNDMSDLQSSLHSAAMLLNTIKSIDSHTLQSIPYDLSCDTHWLLGLQYQRRLLPTVLLRCQTAAVDWWEH